MTQSKKIGISMVTVIIGGVVAFTPLLFTGHAIVGAIVILAGFGGFIYSFLKG